MYYNEKPNLRNFSRIARRCFDDGKPVENWESFVRSGEDSTDIPDYGPIASSTENSVEKSLENELEAMLNSTIADSRSALEMIGQRVGKRESVCSTKTLTPKYQTFDARSAIRYVNKTLKGRSPRTYKNDYRSLLELFKWTEGILWLSMLTMEVKYCKQLGEVPEIWYLGKGFIKVGFRHIYPWALEAIDDNAFLASTRIAGAVDSEEVEASMKGTDLKEAIQAIKNARRVRNLR